MWSSDVRASAFLFPLLVPWLVSGASAAEPVAATAWFTDATIENSVQIPEPAPRLPKALRTAGKPLGLTAES